jgi:hypothetical protein
LEDEILRQQVPSRFALTLSLLFRQYFYPRGFEEHLQASSIKQEAMNEFL